MGGCCCPTHQDIDDQQPSNMMESKLLLGPEKEAAMLKDQGNKNYQLKAYQNAIKCYQQALIKNPNQIVYYTNLALAYRANNQFQNAILIIERLQNLKSPMIIAQKFLICKGKLIKARCLNSITKKYILNNHYQNHQNQKMFKMNKNAIEILLYVINNSDIDVQPFLSHSYKISSFLITIKEKISESQFIGYLKKKIDQSNKGLHNQKNWQKIKQFVKTQTQLLNDLQNFYKDYHQKFLLQAQEQEDYLIDPITYQKFKQPVIVPSGITYEKKTLLQYFSKGEQFKDPITKQKFPIGEKVIVNNICLDKFIAETKRINDIKKQDIQLIVC